VLGHRGARREAPENTLLAFDLALDAGADGVELDVRYGADGALLVIHDQTLTRVTNGRVGQALGDLSLADLEEIDLGAGQRIPTLNQVLAWSRERECRLNVELKSDHDTSPLFVDSVVALLRAEPAGDRVILSSFDASVVARLAAALEDYTVGWLVDAASDLEASAGLAAQHRVRAIHPRESLLSAASVGALRRDFDVVNTWTANDPDRIVELSALGVDAIITDDPALALEALRQAGIPSRR
jgi:glycerophosphoryl diester phosphodiesterase